MHKKIIILSRSFYPGYKAGGPVQSLKALVTMLGGRYALCAITRDRDLGEAKPYPDVQSGEWKEMLGIPVCYISPGLRGLLEIYRAISRNADLDMYYINSFVDPVYSIFVQLLWHLRLIPQKPVVIVPRSELNIMSLRKRMYLPFYKLLGLQLPVFFQALNAREMRGILKHFADKRANKQIFVVPNISLAGQQAIARGCDKSPGKVRFIYLARIEPIKNLLMALGWLRQLKGEIELDIYGLVQDEAYWQACEREIASMPPAVKVKYKGTIPHEQVMAHLARYEFCLHPSRNEGSSNSLIEALASGLPIIISDQAGMEPATVDAGWNLPLSDEAGFIKLLQQCVDMDDTRYQKMSAAARALAAEFTNTEAIAQQHAAMFDAVIASAGKKE